MRPRGECAGRSPRRLLLAALGFACVTLLVPGGVAGGPLPPQETVEHGLMCYCGCSDLTVRVCNCGTAAAIKEDIARRLAAGQTPDQVIEAYVLRYGEQIRSAPTKRGFNLLAWTVPFVAILGAGVLVASFVRRWKAPDGTTAKASDAPSGPAKLRTSDERKLLERIERDIRESL